MGASNFGRSRPAVWLILTFALWCALAATNHETAAAFDGERKGFIIGLGLGFGRHTETEATFEVSQTDPYVKLRYVEFPEVYRSTFCWNPKLGYAPTNHFQIYYANQAGGFRFDDEYWIAGVAGLGISAYLKDSSPSPFVTLATGRVYRFYRKDGSSYGEDGFGWSVGAGYEFYRHAEIELTSWWGDVESPSRRFELWGLKLVLRITAY